MIDDERLHNICLIGKASACCRYIIMRTAGPGGFACAKHQADLRAQIDARVHKMTARGDNCPGLKED